jgi:hypothetical protein
LLVGLAGFGYTRESRQDKEIANSVKNLQIIVENTKRADIESAAKIKTLEVKFEKSDLELKEIQKKISSEEFQSFLKNKTHINNVVLPTNKPYPDSIKGEGGFDWGDTSVPFYTIIYIRF